MLTVRIDVLQYINEHAPTNLRGVLVVAYSL